MTIYERGDIVLVEFIISSQNGSKRRPALVLSTEIYNKSRQELIIAAITSNTERKLSSETILKDWKYAGLLYPSTVTAIIQTIKADMIRRKLGELSQHDLKTVELNLKKALGFR